MKNGFHAKWLLCAALSLAAGSAFAHPGHGASAATSVMSGLLHPFTGFDHVLAMVTVGMWSALGSRSPAEASRLPAAFAALMLAGFVLGLGGPGLPAVEPMIAASLLVVGLLVAMRARLPAWAGMSIVGGFALFHGLAHGVHLAAGGGSLLAYGAGLLTATGALFGAGFGLEAAVRRHARWLVRVAGTGVALYGASLLAT